MLKECRTPTTAHESSADTVLLRREVGGDEGKDIQRDAVDGSGEVLQFADSCECGEDIAFELRNHVKGEATVAVSTSFFNESRTFPQRTAEDTLYGSAPC